MNMSLGADLTGCQEPAGHLIREPDAVVRPIELEPSGVHAKRIDRQHDRLAVTLPHQLRRRFIGGQVHLLSRLRLQSLRQDRVDEARGRPVIQHSRRLLRLQPKLHLDRVTLGRPNPLAVLRDRETLLVAGLNDVQQVVPCEPRSRGITLGYQLINDGSALRIQRQADGVRLVPKNEAQELAELYVTRSHVTPSHATATRSTPSAARWHPVRSPAPSPGSTARSAPRR